MRLHAVVKHLHGSQLQRPPRRQRRPLHARRPPRGGLKPPGRQPVDRPGDRLGDVPAGGAQPVGHEVVDTEPAQILAEGPHRRRSRDLAVHPVGPGDDVEQHRLIVTQNVVSKPEPMGERNREWNVDVS